MSNSGDGLSKHPQLVDRKGQLWQERTVIIRKESSGFGFTLSQQMPVFVDKVFPGSPAERSNVFVGDRILKVNGMSVVGHKHDDVVEMIRDSSFVTLTLLGRHLSNGTAKVQRSDSAQNLEISAPRHLQELTVQSLKMMLQRQRKSYETLSVEYGKQPSEKLEKELKDCESIIKILESEIASKSPAIEAHRQTTAVNIEALTGRQHQGLPNLDERTLAKRLFGGSSRDVDDDHHSSSAPSRDQSRKQSAALSSGSSKNLGVGSSTVSGDASPKPSRSHTFSFSNGSLSPLKQLRFGAKRVGDVSDGSDDDLSDEVDGASEAGPFSSLQELKGSPAHMSVFLHYLYLSKEPKYLLFYLVANSYQSSCKTVDMLRQRGKDICWTFILDHAPLQLNVDDVVKQRILNTLECEESEGKLKSVFVEVRESLSETIITDLANYRHKRIMGLAGMFGDHLLSNHMTYAKQCDVMISTLSQDLKLCLDDKAANNITEVLRNQAIAACLATFMLDVLNSGGSRTGVKLPSMLDKVQSFTSMVKKGKTKRRVSNITKNGHNFTLTTYTTYKTRPNCDLCGKKLWGVVFHGYQCSLCEVNVHRYHCIGEVTAECAGKKKTSRKFSQHKKVNLSVTAEEADNSETYPLPSYPGPRRDEADDESVPSADLVSPPVQDQEAEQPASNALTRRSRAVTDPKSHVLLSQSSSATAVVTEKSSSNEHPSRKDNLSRTQSERLQSKPDSIPKHLSSLLDQTLSTLPWMSSSVHSSTSFSDETQLSGLTKGGSIDEAGGTRLAMLEGDMKELEDDEIESERIPWALKAKRELLQGMKRYEVERQENIRELVYTERTHLQKLKIMKYMYKIPLQKQNILSPQQAEQLFPSLEELILFHNGLCADLKERVNPVQNEICRNIADVLLQRFDGAAGERLCHACSVFAANQAKGDKLLKEWKRKNERFRTFLKIVENEPLCQRLSLTELMPIAWQRLTKYKLLINNVHKSYKKDWDGLNEEDRKEATMIETAHTCVKNILQYVNKQVRRAENRQRLTDLQAKTDSSAMEKAQHPIAQLFKNLDMSAENRRLIHEGPLTWRIQHRKAVELHAVLLNDVLVLLERHDDKYQLRCHTAETVSGSKEELSPVIRLQECLLRHAAHDRGNRTFLVVNNSSLMKLAQMYEFIAEGPQEKKQWEEAIKRAMIGQEDILSPEIPSSPIGNEFPGGRLPLGLSSLTSHLNPRDQLNKIDDDMKKLLMDKLNILRAMQGGVGGHRSTDSTPKHVPAKDLTTPKAIVEAAIKQAGEISSTVAHIMVPNPTKSIIAETQSRLTDIIRELEKNLSRLIIMIGGETGMSGSVESFPSLDIDLASTEQAASDKTSSTPTGDELPFEDGSLTPVQREVEGQESTREETVSRGREASMSDDGISVPSPIPEVDESIHDDDEVSTMSDDSMMDDLPPARSATSVDESSSSIDDSLVMVVAPPDGYLGDDSSTPTPMLDNDSLDSGKSTPIARFLESPSTDVLIGKSSPLVTAQARSLEDQSQYRAEENSSENNRQVDMDSRQPVSPLTVASYSREKERGNGAATSSPRSKGLTVVPSARHESQTSSDSEDKDVISYKLSRETTTSSFDSEVSGPSSIGQEGTSNNM